MDGGGFHGRAVKLLLWVAISAGLLVLLGVQLVVLLVLLPLSIFGLL